jgi:hypothetical protein
MICIRIVKHMEEPSREYQLASNWRFCLKSLSVKPIMKPMLMKDCKKIMKKMVVFSYVLLKCLSFLDAHIKISLDIKLAETIIMEDPKNIVYALINW